MSEFLAAFLFNFYEGLRKQFQTGCENIFLENGILCI